MYIHIIWLIIYDHMLYKYALLAVWGWLTLAEVQIYDLKHI